MHPRGTTVNNYTEMSFPVQLHSWYEVRHDRGEIGDRWRSEDTNGGSPDHEVVRDRKRTYHTKDVSHTYKVQRFLDGETKGDRDRLSRIYRELQKNMTRSSLVGELVTRMMGYVVVET